MIQLRPYTFSEIIDLMDHGPLVIIDKSMNIERTVQRIELSNSSSYVVRFTDSSYKFEPSQILSGFIHQSGQPCGVSESSQLQSGSHAVIFATLLVIVIAVCYSMVR